MFYLICPDLYPPHPRGLSPLLGQGHTPIIGPNPVGIVVEVSRASIGIRFYFGGLFDEPRAFPFPRTPVVRISPGRA